MHPTPPQSKAEWPTHIALTPNMSMLDNHRDSRARISFGEKVKPYYLHDMFGKGVGPKDPALVNAKGKQLQEMAEVVFVSVFFARG